jgi:hypothetical protein
LQLYPWGMSPNYLLNISMGLDTLEMRKLPSQRAKKARKLKHDFITKIKISDEITCIKDTITSAELIKFNK